MKAHDTTPNWSQVVCIASGPSLTEEDCDIVRQWRDADSRRGVIVVNTTYRTAPWADVLYAMDRKWWVHYNQKIQCGEWEPFEGLKYSYVRGCEPAARITLSLQSKNSGHGAVLLAHKFGAKEIFLLAYDCQKTNGKTHHHGDHDGKLKNAEKLPKWPGQFRMLARWAKIKKIEVINCSRATKLSCFPVEPLEQMLKAS